ncbi:MAG: hypothetical protein V3T05_03630 [Myxococcota bacterium]
MVFGKLFGKGPLTDKKIAKISKLASNPFAQTDVRMREMQRLLDDGSTASLKGVLKRFAANASGSIADEDEKKWLEDMLVDRGEVAIEPLRRYIGSENKLTYALRAFSRLAGDQEAVRYFLQVLADYGPEDYRSSEAKLQIVWALSEHMNDERVMPGLIEFVVDHSDDVRWAIMDLVEKVADDGQLTDGVRDRACAMLVRLIQEEETGPRIQQRAAELLAKRNWQVPGDSNALAPSLDETYFIDKKRYLRRRARKKA